MKVGIEGNPLFSFSGNLNGIGQYSKHLIEACLEEDSDTDFEIIRLLMPHRKFIPPLRPYPNLTYRIVKWLPPIIYYQAFKRFGWAPPYDLIALRKYDAVIFTNFVAYPLRKQAKSLVFIYDLSYVRFGQYTSPKNKIYMDRFVPLSINRASNIITISKFSKAEVCDYYNVPEEKVTIITPAVDHKVFYPRNSSSVEEVKKRFSIEKKYILTLCTLEPRKNLMAVLDAFEKLPSSIKDGYSLVLAGGKGWLDSELNDRVAELSVKYSIIKPGYVADEELPALYSGASLFVFPSFYEGFGMPPLEAMACGVPVITSNNSSLPEVVGDAGIMVDADNVSELSEKIEKVIMNKDLAKDLRKKGLAQAKKFTWEESARILLGLLKKNA